MFGAASRIQEMVMITPGMMMRLSVMMPITRASGVLVRSTAQARKAPRANATAVARKAK